MHMHVVSDRAIDKAASDVGHIIVLNTKSSSGLFNLQSKSNLRKDIENKLTFIVHFMEDELL